MKQINFPPSLTTVTTFSKWLALFFLITFPIIGFLLGVTYQQAIQQSTQLYPNFVPTPTPTQTVSTYTSNWKTYFNHKLNYEIKYPQNWRVKQFQDNFDITTLRLSPVKEISGKGSWPYTLELFIGGCAIESTTCGVGQNSSANIKENVTLYVGDRSYKVGISEIDNYTKTKEKIFATYEFQFSLDGKTVEPIYVTGHYFTKEQLNEIQQILSTFRIFDNSSNSSIEGWQTYTNQEYGYSFKYPTNLTLYDKNNIITLNHSIPYVNSGDCDMSGGIQQYDNLNDFNVTFKIKLSKEIELPPYYDGDYKSGILNGKWYWEGIEGCGEIKYYFPIANGKTLLVSKDLVQAYSGISTVWDMDKILNTPGVITYEESEKIFDQILSTFNFTDSDLEDISNWNTYKNSDIGFEIKYPPEYFTRLISKEGKNQYQISNEEMFEKSETAMIITIEKNQNTNFKPTRDKDILNIMNQIGYNQLQSQFPDQTSANFLGDPPWGYYYLAFASHSLSKQEILITTRIHRTDEMPLKEGGTEGQLAVKASQILSTFNFL